MAPDIATPVSASGETPHELKSTTIAAALQFLAEKPPPLIHFGRRQHVGCNADAAAETMQVTTKFHPMIAASPHETDPGYSHHVLDISEKNALS